MKSSKRERHGRNSARDSTEGRDLLCGVRNCRGFALSLLENTQKSGTEAERNTCRGYALLYVVCSAWLGTYTANCFTMRIILFSFFCSPFMHVFADGMYHRGRRLAEMTYARFSYYWIIIKRRRGVILLAFRSSVDGQFYRHFDGQRRNGLAEGLAEGLAAGLAVYQ